MGGLGMKIASLLTPPAEDLTVPPRVLDNRARLRAAFLARPAIKLPSFPLVTHREELHFGGDKLPRGALEPVLVQSFGARLDLRPMLHVMLSHECPHVCACLGVELLESTGLVAWSTREQVNLENYHRDATTLFRRVTKIPDLEVTPPSLCLCFDFNH